ncbi:PKD domain containing protein [Fluviicola taffensis DSM 16823]|uniref:PKD domain containing protein n=2 Tax=Fluviicola TaxID=332102 RepID=F2IHK3_FLUTR|nr:PKD domain containing protein [Fluviicola taffensis DSM 16823]
MPISVSAVNNNQTFNTCNGFIIDSGGQGGPGYGNNETVVVTICPDTPGDVISMVFNIFQLSTTDDNPAANITNVDYMDIYDGNSTAAPTLGTYTGNQLQGVVIMSTPLNTSGCITIRFRSNTVGTGMFTASATCETPCATPTAGGFIVAGETPDSTRICVGNVVDFSGVGSFAAPGFTIANYSWDFMDGTTATGQNTSHQFSAPGQYRVQLIVTDNNGCTNTNLLDLQVFVATIPSFVGFPGDTTLCLGESVVFTAQPSFYPVTWTGFPGSATIDDGCLTDDQLGVAQEIPITQTGFSAGSTLTQASDVQSLCFDMEHSFMGDLVIIVECPNGQSQILHQQGGGGTQIGEPNPADDVDCDDPATQGIPYNYCFTPMATETWVEWSNNNGFGGTVPAGDYEPVQPFTNLVGCPLNGVWTLIVVDNWASDDGTLFTFELNLAPNLYEPVTTFEPQIGVGSDSSYWVMPATFATMSTNGDVLTVVPTASGTFNYSYVVLDNYGCQNDSTVTLTVNENPQADAGLDATICNGLPLQLDGNIVGGNNSCDYTFNLEDTWGDGWNGNNLIVIVNGVTSTFTIPGGLTSSFTLSIPNGAAFTVQFDGAGNFIGECSYEVLDAAGAVVLSDGTNGNASTTTHNLVGNCLGNLTYQWTPAGSVSNPAILDPIATVNGNTTLTLSVYPTGHPLCVTTDQVNVSISASANPGTNNTLTTCGQGAPTDLFPLLGPGASPNGTWRNPAGAAVVMPYDPITMNPGAYVYTVDSNGCISSATITVTEINPTAVAVATASNCHGLPNGSAAITSTNASEYSLNGGANTPINGSPFTINGLMAGSYQVVVYNVGGCTDTVDFVITEPVALSITSISPDLVVCSGDISTINVTGSGGSSPYTFTWFTNAGVQGVGNPIAVTTTLTTQYCVVLTEACGSMPDSSCMIITVPQPLNLVLTPDDADGCFPHHVIFSNVTAGPGIPATSTIDFGDGSPTITTNALDTCSHTYESPGVYTVSITSVSDSACTYSNTFPDMITVYGNPTANFNITPNPTTIFETHIMLYNSSSTDVVDYNWSIQGGTPNQSNFEDVSVDLPEGVPGNYNITLIVTSINGCIDSITKIAQVLSDVIVYAPNTFTPDGDEFNQTWFLHIDGIDIFQFNLKLFNRWGENIWESHDPKASWDGTYQGKIVPAGGYTWILETRELVSDKKYTFTGHINVLR